MMYHLSFLILMVANDDGLSSSISAISQRAFLVVLYRHYNEAIIYFKLSYSSTQFSAFVVFVILHAFGVENSLFQAFDKNT